MENAKIVNLIITIIPSGIANVRSKPLIIDFNRIYVIYFNCIIIQGCDSI